MIIIPQSRSLNIVEFMEIISIDEWHERSSSILQFFEKMEIKCMIVLIDTCPFSENIDQRIVANANQHIKIYNPFYNW